MQKKLNKTLVKLVSILNDGAYHDGTSIGDKLKMTRSAVWKAMHKLANHNVKINSVKGKGYALLEPLILLDVQRIKKALTEKCDITIFENIDSTNDYLKSLKGQRGIKLCLAEQQTKGKGRLGRSWHSPFAKNIYLSCLYPFQKDVSELAGLSLVTGIAIFRTLQTVGVTEKLYLKWPNDVLYDNHKLSGTLIEIQAETHGSSQAIIGIGINVNMLNDDGGISQAWTSVQKILGQYVDRNDVCAILINQLLKCLQEFNRKGFAPFIAEWMHAEYLANRVIILQNLHDKIEGKVTGINEQGHLLLKLPNGKVRAFSSGDASIVKKS